MPEPTVQPARALLHAHRISNRALAQRAGRSSEFIGRVLLGQARPPKWLQDLLVELLQRPLEDLFTHDALAGAPRFPGDAGVVRPAVAPPPARAGL